MSAVALGVPTDLAGLVHDTARFARSLRTIACGSRDLVRALDPLNAYHEAAHVIDAVLERSILDFLCGQPAIRDVHSEESGHVTFREEGYSVVLDPLDGTRNYCMGLSYYALAAAFLDSTGAVVGSVVTNLATGNTCRAIRGAGAFQGRRRLRVLAPPNRANSDAIFVGLTKDARDRAVLMQVASHLRSFRAMGCAALDLCCLATGGCAVFLDVSQTAKLVDVLASALVVTEAGGEVTDESGTPIIELTNGAPDLPHVVYEGRPMVIGAASPLLGAWLREETDSLRSPA